MLSKSSFKTVSKKNSKNSSQIWVPKVIEVLSVDNVVNLLLSFFMETISKETVSVDEVETPGIPSITAFEKFGSKLVNKYIYTVYLKSDVFKKGKSLTYFKSISYFSVFDEDVFIAKLGGHFVGALLEVDLLYQELDVKIGTIKETEYYIRVDNTSKKNLLRHCSKFLHIPQKLPMVCKPKDFFFTVLILNIILWVVIYIMMFIILITYLKIK